MRLNVNTGTFRHRSVLFTPDSGRPKSTGRSVANNPSEFEGDGVYSALVIVGLEARSGAKHEIGEVIDAVKRVREKQVGNPDSSFMYQKGLYKYKSGRVGEEDSVRIIMMNVEGTDKEKETNEEFKKNVLTMTEELCEKFDQELIFVEFQNKGLSEGVYRVWA